MSIPFDASQGLVVVPARIHGPRGDVIAQLALDTGATGTMINWGILVMLGYDPAVVDERIQVTTGSGVEYVPRLGLEKIECLEIERADFPVLCHTLPPSATVDGLLGLDFLRNAKVTIDLREGKVTVE